MRGESDVLFFVACLFVLVFEPKAAVSSHNFDRQIYFKALMFKGILLRPSDVKKCGSSVYKNNIILLWN